MAQKYLCPECEENETDFELLYRMSREIKKDPETGDNTYRESELKPDANDSSASQTVRCSKCRYTSSEDDFIV